MLWGLRRISGMELQRHCAEDWNQFAGILIQCLFGPELLRQLQEIQMGIDSAVPVRALR